MPRPRALLVTPDFPPNTGGIELVMGRLAAGLREVELSVVTLGADGDSAYDRSAGIPVTRVARQRARNRAAVLALNGRALAAGLRHRPDLLLCGHVVASPAVAALRLALGRPSIQYAHAEEFRDRPGVAAFAVRHADAIVAVSRYSAELARDAGARLEGIHRVPLGVELPSATPPPMERRDEAPTLVTVARLRDREKGHATVLRALPEIRRRAPGARWIVIGEGPLRPELEREADRLGLAAAVHFAGALPDADRDAWLDRAHVFVLPNYAGEGFGIVFLEAAAHGLPVVAGRIGGALDAVLDGETGLLVPARDPAAVAGAVAELLTDRERASRMGASGAARARRYTWEAHVGGVERLMLDMDAARRLSRTRIPRGRR